MQKSSFRSNRYLIFITMYLPARIDALSGSKGESPFANSSEFTKCLHWKSSGSSVYDAVVFPDPLQPDIIYNFGTIICHFSHFPLVICHFDRSGEIFPPVMPDLIWHLIQCVTPYPNSAKSPLQGSPGNISSKADVISRAVTKSFWRRAVRPNSVAWAYT